MAKSTVEQIRARFDSDVERFSNLETGQSATMDAPLVLELITSAASRLAPGARSVLDVGCGAGNYTVKLLEKIPGFNATLVDLSRPMLDRATERVLAAGAGKVTTFQGDVRELSLPPNAFDIIMAAAVLHHLRGESEWENVFRKFHDSLAPGGSLWISDYIEHDVPAVQAVMTDRFGDYLKSFKGEAYRDHVFAYIEQEDTPRSLTFQMEMLRKVGFAQIDVLHKNGPFAAFVGRKSETA